MIEYLYNSLQQRLASIQVRHSLLLGLDLSSCRLVLLIGIDHQEAEELEDEDWDDFDDEGIILEENDDEWQASTIVAAAAAITSNTTAASTTTATDADAS
jgi:hypothetical protein